MAGKSRQIRSKSNPREFHDVRKSELTGALTCDCVAYQMRGACRHIKIVENKGQMQINETYLKLSGRVPINFPVAMDDNDLTLSVVCAVVKREEHSNQDGSKDIVWVAKPIEIKKNEQ